MRSLLGCGDRRIDRTTGQVDDEYGLIHLSRHQERGITGEKSGPVRLLILAEIDRARHDGHRRPEVDHGERVPGLPS